MNRQKVLLLFGGESSEHDVSITSARNVYAAADKDKYDINLAYIDRTGSWWLVESIEEAKPSVSQLVPIFGSGHFMVMPEKNEIHPDVILPILHGKNGEDGSVAALAQLLHIPIVGCDMTSGAICMDKVATKQVVAAYDIPVVPYVAVRNDSGMPTYEAISRELGEVVFVKPSRSGSSVGVSKAKDKSEFMAALSVAFEHSDVALIESAVDAREIELAVLGTPPHHKVSTAGEIIPDAEFYTYESKYSSESTSEAAIPADLTSVQLEDLQRYAAVAFEALGCSGLARIDFFVTKNGKIYLNEVNTLPGFTDISMYPKLWQEEGLSYSQLIDELIADAID